MYDFLIKCIDFFVIKYKIDMYLERINNNVKTMKYFLSFFVKNKNKGEKNG